MVDIDKINNITVVGSGVMGREIAQVALMAGFKKVTSYSRSQETLNKAVKFIEDGLKKMKSKKMIAEGTSIDSLMKNHFTERDLQKAVEDADFVFESVPEVMELKQDIFNKLGEYTPKHTILATNTSTMSITKIAEKSNRPEKVIGMHFFTPIPVLRLIEIIKGEKTSDDTVQTALEVGKKLPALRGERYLPVIQKETPGFIVNRLGICGSLYLNWLLDYATENNIPLEQIDADLGKSSNLGVFARWDYFGLDTIYNVAVYFAETLSPEFAPGKILTKLVKEGNLGKKTGKGLYEWKDGNPVLDWSKKAKLFDIELSIAIQLNEACRLLEEGVVSSCKMIDETMLAGMGRPGPFALGVKNYKKWTKFLEDFCEKTGIEYLKPCKLLKSGEFLKME
ncbi:MAG: 3-hydroxyacyl-CoA dehydrogenase NAD-binding domain-containing protein [Promethearchaeota archaeon]